MSALTVRALMTEDVVTIAPDTPLTEVADLMWRHGFRHAPVVDGDRLVGIVSHTDLVRAGLADPADAERPAGAAAAVMSPEPQTVGPDDSAAVAGRALLYDRIGCLPVVDDGRLVGILTDADFVRYVVQLAAP
jgi:acetoin utilization protein AcuB